MKITKLPNNSAFGAKKSLWAESLMASIASAFLIDENGKIEKVFDKFKTSEHHQVVLDYLRKYEKIDRTLIYSPKVRSIFSLFFQRLITSLEPIATDFCYRPVWNQ